jgi:hypothetical protein
MNEKESGGDHPGKNASNVVNAATKMKALGDKECGTNCRDHLCVATDRPFA